jgi:hypothetical protein
MKHKHSELIKAWADGAEIEQWESNRNTRWTLDPNPTWQADEYRIKPKPETITETLWVCFLNKEYQGTIREVAIHEWVDRGNYPSSHGLDWHKIPTITRGEPK